MKNIKYFSLILYIFILLVSCNDSSHEVKMVSLKMAKNFTAKTPSDTFEYSKKSYENGKTDAKNELEKPVFALEVYGYPTLSRIKYSKLLNLIYGIEIRTVAGCVVNNDIVDHAKGFNEVMEKAIKERFGRNTDELINDTNSFEKTDHVIESSFDVELELKEKKEYIMRTRSIKRINIKQIKKIKHIKPIYPEIAKNARIRGIVIIENKIDALGKVERWKIISGHPLLNQAAINAIKKWEYEPYFVKGVPKPVLFTISINFNQNN